MYVQQAPVPVQASFVWPAMFASKINQLNEGGVALIIINIIKRVSKALKLLVLIFLLSKSKYFIPENSILNKCKPIKPKTNGN